MMVVMLTNSLKPENNPQRRISDMAMSLLYNRQRMLLGPAYLLFFHAWEQFFVKLSPGSASGQHFGPGTFLVSKMGPEKHEFAMESFCHDNSGEIPKPK